MKRLVGHEIIWDNTFSVSAVEVLIRGGVGHDVIRILNSRAIQCKFNCCLNNFNNKQRCWNTILPNPLGFEVITRNSKKLLDFILQNTSFFKYVWTVYIRDRVIGVAVSFVIILFIFKSLVRQNKSCRHQCCHIERFIILPILHRLVLIFYYLFYFHWSVCMSNNKE